MHTFIDLFAGCGGFSVGLQAAGLKSLAEVELDAWACESLSANFVTSRILHGDIRDFDDATIRAFSGVDVVVGGPPCQGFSVAGPTQFGADDPRNELPHWFLHWVGILRPRIAVIENVPNILTKSLAGGSIFAGIQQAFAQLGYATQHRILNAADYGVPQLRRRAFIVATLPGVSFEFPNPTHKPAEVADVDLFDDIRRQVTVGEALLDLPQIEAGDGTDDIVPYPSTPQNLYQSAMRKGSAGVLNHVAMKHTARLIERFRIIRAGQSLKDVPREYGQIEKMTGKVSEKPFKYNNYRLDPDKPSLAIPASFQSLFLHPILNRNLTAREAARLMGFPDVFRFMGKRTTMSWEKHLSQYNQIGNAVCPPVAEAIGRSISAALRTAPRGNIVGKIDATAAHMGLTRREPLPLVKALKEKSAGFALQAAGQTLLVDQQPEFKEQGFSIPAAALAIALLCATDPKCKVCSPRLAPFGSHTGEIPFLISKDGIESLSENGQDHGLDYHLRALLDIDHQVGHLVAERLAQLGLVQLLDVFNPRTGRRVRGMKVLRMPAQIENLRCALSPSEPVAAVTGTPALSAV